MDKEDLIKLILLEDKDKKYKLQDLIYDKKSDLLFILLTLNTKYYKKYYKFSVDNWYELIISNEFYFDKCPENIKLKFSNQYKIIDKYPNTRFFYYNIKENSFYKKRYIEHILSKYPEYIDEVKEKLNIDIFKDFNRDAWINLIDKNPTYYYDKCPQEYSYYITKYLNWKKIIIYDIKFLEIYNNLNIDKKSILGMDEWYWILIKHITNIKKIPKIVLISLLRYQWIDIIKKNPSIIKRKKYSKYFQKYLDSKDFWYELISYDNIFIKYCPKDIFEILLNEPYFVIHKLIIKNIKYLKFTSIEKLLNANLDYIDNFLSLDFKFLYKIPKDYLKKALHYNRYYINKTIILNFMDIDNLGFYIKFKDQDGFIDELKKIDKKFKKNYEKFLKYLEVET